MVRFRLLPWEYGIRNLLRRPLRSGLTMAGLTMAVLLVLLVIGFVRGLERMLAETGGPRVALVFALNTGENVEYSSIPAATADLLAASLEGVQDWHGRRYVSPELYQAVHVSLSRWHRPAMGLVRGVTPAALLVRPQVQIVEGAWPGSGEILAGELAAAKLGVPEARLAVGQTVELEGRTWRVSGRFAARASAFASELWCRLDDLQAAMRRQDLTLVALTMVRERDFAAVSLFCKSRADLEVQAVRETDYYALLRKDYGPVRAVAWLVVALVASAGALAAVNLMHGAVLGRMRECAMLQTLGYARRAFLLSIVQEGVVLAMASSLVASALAMLLLDGVAVRFTMGALALEMDGVTVLLGLCMGLTLGVLGAGPPALLVLRTSVVDGLRAV